MLTRYQAAEIGRRRSRNTSRANATEGLHRRKPVPPLAASHLENSASISERLRIDDGRSTQARSNCEADRERE